MSRATTAIEALEATLRREIAALEAGDFGALVETKDEKERRGAELERCLADDPGAIPRDRLYTLKALIAQNAVGIEEAMSATRDAARAVAEVRTQHSVASHYGPSGTKPTKGPQLSTGLNKIF